MASLIQTPTQVPLKLEHSPAESWVSVPGDPYPSLFGAVTPAASDVTVNPMDVLTPRSESRSCSEERQNPCTLSTIPESETTETSDSPSSDKKPTKKRKSWGQVLPEPKTNLPPRKRAKTEDEKEQRRVERVLRNRRAAQSSRERKRLEVEALEKRNKELEALVQSMQKTQQAMADELFRIQREHGIVTPNSSPIRAMPVTLSQELFSSQDAKMSINSPDSIPEDLPTSTTINPSSLSPELRPVSDSSENATQQSKVTETKEKTATTSPDVTQRPAVMLSDLPCHISAELLQLFPVSQTSTRPLSALLLQVLRTLHSASANPSTSTLQPLKLDPTASRPNSESSLPPRPPSTTTTWPVLTHPSPMSLISNSSTSSSLMTRNMSLKWYQRATSPRRTTLSTANSSTLNIKFLQFILSSSPSLARPHVDATMAALRLVTEKLDNKVGNFYVDLRESRGNAERAPFYDVIVSSTEKVLTSTRGSCRLESVTQETETAMTDVAQLRLDERLFSYLVYINSNGSSSMDYVTRRLGMGKTGQRRLEESMRSMVNVQKRQNQDWVVLSNLRIQEPTAMPSDLHHLITFPCLLSS